MTDYRPEWDYYELKRHEAAHAKDRFGCICLIGWAIVFVLWTLPLAPAVHAYWMAKLCECGALPKPCHDKPLLEWPKSTVGQ